MRSLYPSTIKLPNEPVDTDEPLTLLISSIVPPLISGDVRVLLVKVSVVVLATNVSVVGGKVIVTFPPKSVEIGRIVRGLHNEEHY